MFNADDEGRILADPSRPLWPETGIMRLGGLVPILSTVAVPLFSLFYAGIHVAYQDFYAELGLTPPEAGIQQSTILARAGALIGFLFLIVATWALLCYVLFLMIEPLSRSAARDATPKVQFLYWLSAIAIGLAALVAVSTFVGYVFGRVFLTLWLPGGGLALMTAWMLAGPPQDKPSGTPTRALRFARKVDDFLRARYRKGFRRILIVALFLALGLLVALPLYKAWEAAPKAGRQLRETGVVDKSVGWFMSVPAPPAQLISLGTDPLGVCKHASTYVILSRDDESTLVLVVPADGKGSGQVFPLPQSEYRVVTDLPGPPAPRRCTITGDSS